VEWIGAVRCGERGQWAAAAASSLLPVYNNNKPEGSQGATGSGGAGRGEEKIGETRRRGEESV
jgi:hypothetical protein